MAEQDAIQRMQVWWNTLDQSTKGFFEQLYERDRDGVLAVVSGGEVPAREGTLASFLDANVFDVLDNIPRIDVQGEVTVDPASPDANQPFTLSWTETNSTKADCLAYTDLVQVFDDGGAVVFEQSLNREALPVGGTVQGSMQVTGLPMGVYSAYISTNADGIDQGAGQPTAQGFKGYGNAQVGVGGADISGRPGSPAEADLAAVANAYAQLYNAYNSRGEEEVRGVIQALYAFAGAVDPGGVLTEGAEYKNDLMVQTLQRAQGLESAVDQGLQFSEEAETAFKDEVMAALQAIYPASVDVSRLRESANEIQAAIVAIGRNSLRL
jgi:hypothetical protein